MRDLENESVMEIVTRFSQRMRAMHEHLDHAKKSHYKLESQPWFLDGVGIHWSSVFL